MPDREPVDTEDWCRQAVRWKIDPDTMKRLALSAEEMFEETRQEVVIVSGYRTFAEQEALRRAGRPTAPDELSTHRSCPSTGVDVTWGFAPVKVQIWIWGRILRMNGLRWGGGGPQDEDGMPVDWQHLDRGPRLG